MTTAHRFQSQHRPAQYASSTRHKRALVSYVTHPFTIAPESPQHLAFSNFGIAKSIVAALLELGYEVTLVSFDDASFQVDGHYDLFIGHGGINWLQLCQQLSPETVKIYFSTGTYWKRANALERERFVRLKSRTGAHLPLDRVVDPSEELANRSADGIICLGNGTNKASYSGFPTVINLNSAVYLDAYPTGIKNFDSAKHRFLFIAGPGNVHKGLDLLIETFSKLDAHLYCATLFDEKFIRLYEPILKRSPNIHLVGWVSPRSTEFYRLMEECAFVIYPSCAEGQPGSVLEAMQYGLVPIVSENSNIDTKDFGFTLYECSIQGLTSLVQELRSWDAHVVEVMSLATRREIEQFYNPEVFIGEMKRAVTTIVEKTQKTAIDGGGGTMSDAGSGKNDVHVSSGLKSLAIIKSLLEGGDGEAALALVKQTEMLLPASPELLTLKAEALYVSGELGAAEALLRELVTEFPGRAEILNNLGVILWSTERHVQALDVMRQALAADRYFREAVLNAASMFSALGDSSSARRICTEYLKAHADEDVEALLHSLTGPLQAEPDVLDLSGPLFVTAELEVFQGNDALERLRNCNDAAYLGIHGVVQVDKERWRLAQKYERKTWMEASLDAVDDRNFDHLQRFRYYQALGTRRFERAIELGCGPFTNMRLLLDYISPPGEVTLLDPLISDYLSHPHCTYRDGHLKGVPVRIVPSSIEEFEVDVPFDLVVMNNVLEHCFDIERIFDRVNECLAPGGVFVFADNVFRKGEVEELVKNQFDAGHPLKVTEDLIDNLLSKNFTELYREKYFGLYDQPYRIDVYFIGKKG